MQTYRHHDVILNEAGGVAAVRRKLAEMRVELPDATVRSWASRRAIPAQYWSAFDALGFATLDELAAAAAASAGIDLVPDGVMAAASQNEAAQTTRKGEVFSGQPVGENSGGHA